MDKTPIFDIKPYVVYADSHPGARSGFVDDRKWQKLDVEISEDVDRHLRLQGLNAEKIEILKEVLAQDPRPHYQKDPHKVYGMPYEGLDIEFTVCEKRDTYAYCCQVDFLNMLSRKFTLRNFQNVRFPTTEFCRQHRYSWLPWCRRYWSS